MYLQYEFSVFLSFRADFPRKNPWIMGGKGKWYELVYINFSINFECHEFFKDVFCYTIC